MYSQLIAPLLAVFHLPDQPIVHVIVPFNSRMCYDLSLTHPLVLGNLMTMPSENVTSGFCNHFSIIPSYYACKMCSNYPGVKLVISLLYIRKRNDKNLSLSAHVVHTTAKQISSHRRWDENDCETAKKMTYKKKKIACNT